MRLTYNNETYVVNNSKNKKSTKNVSLVTRTRPRKKDIAETYNEFVKCQSSSYKDLMKIIRKEEFIKIQKSFYTWTTDTELFVAKQYGSGKIIPFIYYKFENNNIRDIIHTALKTHNGDGKKLLASSENSYHFIASADVLDFMFTYADITTQGIEPYKKFKKKVKTKVRELVAPQDDIKIKLREINSFLQKVYDKRNIDFQVAYKKGKSIKSNAEIHENKKFVYNIDLHDFFPSCKRDLVKKYIKFMFNNTPNKTKFIDLFLDMILMDDALFIGSPISGTLANAIISKPVQYLKHITKKFDMSFSVYADDMSFGSDRFISKTFVISIFNVAFNKYDLGDVFSLNENKCVGYTNDRKVTGVIINKNNDITIKKSMYRDIRTKLHHLHLGDPVNVECLRGKIAFATHIDSSGKMYRYLQKFYPTVKKYNLCSDEKLEELKNRTV